MEIYCADCGCLVERGARLIPCGTPECCCLDLPLADPMVTIAARIRTAFNTRDRDAFRALIAEDATWGDDPDSDRYCPDRDHIIATYQVLMAGGVSGTMVETITGPNGVAYLLEVHWPDDEPHGRGTRFYQAFCVSDGLVTRIEGHDDDPSARAAISN